MLSYIEKILRDKCRVSKTILWENILTLLKESELGLNNIYNNLYDALDYLSDNYFITKRLNNYKVFYNVHIKNQPFDVFEMNLYIKYSINLFSQRNP